MEIILENNTQKLIVSDSEKYLIAKEELELPIWGRYYFKFAYIPPTMTLEECEEKYIETEIEEENDDN